MIVVDTNVLTYLYIQGPYTELAERLWKQDSDWIAPLFWRSEFSNVIASYMSFKSMSLARGLELAAKAESQMSGHEYDVSSESVLKSASASKRSAYDCEFITLAQDFGVPLVTTDNDLVKSFPKIAIHLRAFVKRASDESQ